MYVSLPSINTHNFTLVLHRSKIVTGIFKLPPLGNVYVGCNYAHQSSYKYAILSTCNVRLP